MMIKPVNFSLGLLKRHFLFSCDSTLAVCCVGRQAVFDATKQEVKIKQQQREILRLDNYVTGGSPIFCEKKAEVP